MNERVMIDIQPDSGTIYDEIDITYKYQVTSGTRETPDGEETAVYTLYQSQGLRTRKVKEWYTLKGMFSGLYDEIENAEWFEF